MKKDAISWTGERYMPEVGKNLPEGTLEHYNRYYMAQSYCQNKDVLDIASGEGYGTELLSQVAQSVIGVDLDELAVQHASSKYVRPNLRYLVRNATNLNLGERKFDVVVCFEMLEHIYEQEEMFKEVKKVLKPNGLFIVSTPNKYISSDIIEDDILHEKNDFHVKELYFDEFQDLTKSYYKNCKYYSQRVYSTAQIWPHFSERELTVETAFNWVEQKAIKCDSKEKIGMNYIALCSDTEISDSNTKHNLVDTSNLLKNYYENEIKELFYKKSHNFVKIYFDEGEGYSEDNVLVVDYPAYGIFSTIDRRFLLPSNIKSLRIDPIDEAYGIVRNFSITCEGRRVDLELANFKLLNDKYHVFDDKNSQYIINCQKNEIQGKEISIKFEVMAHNYIDTNLLLQKEYAIYVQQQNLSDKNFNELRENFERETSELRESFEKETSELRESFEKETSNLKSQRIDLLDNNIRMEALLNCMTKAKETLDNDKRILTRQLEFSDEQMKKTKEETNQWMYQCVFKDNEILELKTSTSWKLTKPFRFIVRSVKKFIPKKLVKFIRVVKSEGIHSAGIKTKQYFKQKSENHTFIEEMGYHNDINNAEMYMPYESKYQNNEDFSDKETNIKALAFFLPQFHTFPENDEWWGKGFTEWTNTTKATPRFNGHYQPRTPHKDIGYYDLSDIDVLKKQARLAKQHGIYGFCFYYYWFSGKRLMEKPVDLLLENKDIELPFCLCWANENWTRAWDGQDKEIIMEQKYLDEEPELFIRDMKKYVEDNRYIRKDGKPVIVVYNPGALKNGREIFSKWRETARKEKIGEILIWTCQTANNTAEKLGILEYIDAEIEFPPHNMWDSNLGIKNLDVGGKEAYIYNYKILVDKIAKAEPLKEIKTLYRSCMLGWDNAARRENGWTTFYGYSLKSFYKWVRTIVTHSAKEEKEFIFVNAWNEWAEGTYLEPDDIYGYANINTFSKGIFELPLNHGAQVISTSSLLNKQTNLNLVKSFKIAVQIHLFYLDALEELLENLCKMPSGFDCYISTDTDAKARFIKLKFEKAQNVINLFVEVFDNRGRDIAPFIMQLSMNDRYKQYDIIGHFHSKKTHTSLYGEDWRHYLYKHLLGSSANLAEIFRILENEDIGIVFPDTYPPLLNQAEWGGNKEGAQQLMNKLSEEFHLPEEPVFPVGNMFWAKRRAIADIFKFRFLQKDFPQENGQFNLTRAHEIERLWVYIAENNGFGYAKTFNNTASEMQIERNKVRIAFFVHYDKDNAISDADMYLITEIDKIVDELIFVTNSELQDEQLMRVRPHCEKIIVRSNKGYDFGAWKDSMIQIGWEKLSEFDELILVNNSCYGPIFDMESIFQKMENKRVDFWGMTLFPHLYNAEYLDGREIPEHIQSYFQVFNKSVFMSEDFQNFWKTQSWEGDLKNIIAKGETQLTKCLFDANFSYSVYIPETKYISELLLDYSTPYTKPYQLALLGLPFIKKKSKDHMSFEEEANMKFLLKQLKLDFF